MENNQNMSNFYNRMSLKVKAGFAASALALVSLTGGIVGYGIGENEGYIAGARDTENFWADQDPESYRQLRVSEMVAGDEVVTTGVIRMSTPLETRVFGEPHIVMTGAEGMVPFTESPQ